MSAPRPPAGVYLVLDADVCRSAGNRPEDVAAVAVAAGISAVQLRAKRAGTRELLDLTERLAEVVSGRATLLVNDRLDVVLGARVMASAALLGTGGIGLIMSGAMVSYRAYGVYVRYGT